MDAGVALSILAVAAVAGFTAAAMGDDWVFWLLVIVLASGFIGFALIALGVL